MKITLNELISNGLIANEGVLTEDDIKLFWEYVNDNFLDISYEQSSDMLSDMMVIKTNDEYEIEKNKEHDFINTVFEKDYYDCDIQVIFLRIKKRKENYNNYIKKGFKQKIKS